MGQAFFEASSGKEFSVISTGCASVRCLASYGPLCSGLDVSDGSHCAKSRCGHKRSAGARPRIAPEPTLEHTPPELCTAGNGPWRSAQDLSGAGVSV